MPTSNIVLPVSVLKFWNFLTKKKNPQISELFLVEQKITSILADPVLTDADKIKKINQLMIHYTVLAGEVQQQIESQNGQASERLDDPGKPPITTMPTVDLPPLPSPENEQNQSVITTPPSQASARTPATTESSFETPRTTESAAAGSPVLLNQTGGPARKRYTFLSVYCYS